MQPLFIGIVPNEYMELTYVFVTVIFSLGLMVLFGRWWER